LDLGAIVVPRFVARERIMCLQPSIRGPSRKI
jgi:hypothetical protein